jgi:hypothetical protein
MTTHTTAKLALALAGVVVFGVSVRLDNPTLRWVAIGLFSVALLLRFVKDRPPD